MSYIECVCPNCGSRDLEDPSYEVVGNTVEDCYRCLNCEKLVIFVFDHNSYFKKEWHEAPPLYVYVEDEV